MDSRKNRVEGIGHFRITLCLCIKTSVCETIHMEMRAPYKFIFMQIKLIFIRKVLHKDLELTIIIIIFLLISLNFSNNQVVKVIINNL